MGKGDRKSRRGKLWRGSHGNRRPKVKPTGTVTEEKTEKKGKRKARKKSVNDKQ